MTTIDEIKDNFALLDEWDDRYRYVIELGRTLAPLPDETASPRTRCRAAPARCGSPSSVEPQRRGEPVLNIRRRQRRAHRARTDRDPAGALFRPERRSEILETDAIACSTSSASASTCRRSAPTACARWSSASAAMPATRCHGFLTNRRSVRNPAQSVLCRDQRLPLRCWPSPIFLASCERVTA